MFCKECGKEINNEAVICVGCGVSTGERQPDAAMRMLLPVGRSGYAIAAGYLGLISVLLIPAPLAIIFGILAIRDIKKNKNKHGMVRAILGITLGAICITYFAYLFIVFS